MREGWKEVKLANYYTISSGLSKSADQFGSGFPFVSFKNVFWNFFLPQELTELVNTTEKERKTCSVKEGDVFLTRTSEKIEELGMSSVALKDYPNATFNGFTKRLRPKNDNDIDPRFIGFYLRTPQFRAEITAYSTLTTRASLNNDIIERLRILLPPLPTQRKIASILSGYDDLIENNLKRIKLLEEKAQLTYEEWFVKMRFPGYETAKFDEVTGLPEGWKEGKLSDLIEYQSGFAFKSSKFKEEGYPIIKIKNIGNNTIDFNNVDYIDIEYANQVVKFQLNAGDLLIAMTGATVGKVGIMPKSNVPCYLNQRVGRFVSLKSIDNKAFIECFFNIGSGLNQVLNIAGGAAQPNISANQILSIETIVPSDTILKDFSQMATSITNSVINLQNQNRLLKEARDILLPRLMSGMVDVEELKIETLQTTEQI
jgi:type I restriction enzyme S subunit